MRILFLCFICTALWACQSDKVVDIEGNEYKIVRIGEQVWMAENLRTTKFKDGTSIANIPDFTMWANTSGAAYCFYDNHEEYSRKYGNLYNWYAVNHEKGLAPSGWRIPTPEDINILIEYLGTDTIAGGKIKETGMANWLLPNVVVENSAGFLALPAGYRNGNDGKFYTLGSNAYWWSNNQSYEVFSWSKRFFKTFADVERDSSYKKYAFAVRCIKIKEN